MKKTSCILLLLFSACCSVLAQPRNETQLPAHEGKTVTVYTTAEGTNLRITQTDKVTLSPALQPIESEISIFVNPNKSFQTLLGIGGAITDASAEVFAKLSKAKQEE